MDKLEAGRGKKSIKIAGASPDPNNVIVTVYVESSLRESLLPGSKSTNKNNPFRKTTTSHCYDRRAELLAHTRQLRDSGGSPQVQWPRRSSRPKSKKWKWSRIRAPFLRIFRRKEGQWRYERIESEDYNHLGQSSHAHKRSNTRNKKCLQRSNSGFCRKLKQMIKKLSCGLQCNKGHKDELI